MPADLCQLNRILCAGMVMTESEKQLGPSDAVVVFHKSHYLTRLTILRRIEKGAGISIPR